MRVSGTECPVHGTLLSCRRAFAPNREPLRHALRSRRTKLQHFLCRAAEKLTLFSPSKVNLFLRVVRKRDDGYHDLASLFHIIDLGDEMHLQLLSNAQKDELTCNVEDIPTDDSNLVIKALNLYRRKTSTNTFFRVHLAKQVPHGAGLGGGSGNAATALWAANELSGRAASNAELLEWSGDIGSDISVFFSQGAAFCTGRGEIVQNVAPPLPLDTPLLLVKPPVGLSTPQIFRALDLGQRSTIDPVELLQGLATDPSRLAELCVNDLEQPAFDTLEELRVLRDRLQRESSNRFHAVFMTGSGSTIVGVGSDQAPDFLKEPQYSKVFVRPARFITRCAGQWYVPSSAQGPA